MFEVSVLVSWIKIYTSQYGSPNLAMIDLISGGRPGPLGHLVFFLKKVSTGGLVSRHLGKNGMKEIGDY